MKSAEKIIQQFDLQPLPREGGWFRQTYLLQEANDNARATAIFFLLRDEMPTQLHRLASDEIFHAYAGDPVEILILEEDKSPSTRILGNPIHHPQAIPQLVIRGGTWQAARLLKSEYGFSLMGTTMCPGFCWDSFEEGDIEIFMKTFPDNSDLFRPYVRSIH